MHEGAVARPRTPAAAMEGQWRTVCACPACGAHARVAHGTLPERRYRFEAATVLIPAPGITVHQCGACGLVYKSPVPAPEFLTGLFVRHAARKWRATAGLDDEAAARAEACER
jgi:rubredoxin